MTQYPDFMQERNHEVRWAVDWATPVVSVISDLDYQSGELRKLFLALVSPGGLSVPDDVRLNVGPAIVATDFAGHAFVEIAREMEVLAADLLSLEKSNVGGVVWRRVDRVIVRGAVEHPDSIVPRFPTLAVNDVTLPKRLDEFAEKAETLKWDIHRALAWDQVLFEEKIVGRAERFKTALEEVRQLLLVAKRLLDRG